MMKMDYIVEVFLCINPMIHKKLKILVLGGANTGKTTILNVFHNRNCIPSPTIGIEVTSVLVRVPIRFYDMGGSRYWWGWISENLKHTDLIFLFYDVSRPETLKEADEIMQILVSKRNDYRVILVGNKTDLERNIDIFIIYPFIQKWRIEGIVLSHIEINRRDISAFRQVMKRVTNGLINLKRLDEYRSREESSWSIFNWV